MEPTLLELSAVTRRFGGLTAVDSVSGRLQQGQVLGLIGPNGSGKTTLLSLIACSLRPSGGEIRFRGSSMAGWRQRDAARAGIARAFQVPQLAAGLTILENVMLGALFGHRELSRRQARIEALAALDAVGLEPLADRQPFEASLGERRGIELARLVVMQPRLALLDEIMGGLSVRNIQLAEGIIARLRAEGTTLVVVEHVAGVVARVADEICVLHEGRVLVWGSPSDVLADRRVIDAYMGRTANAGG